MSYLSAEHKRLLALSGPIYHEAEAISGVPWALLAAIHYRENDCRVSSPGPGGAMQKDPPWTAGEIAHAQAALGVRLGNPESDVRTAILMAAWFIQTQKARPPLAAGSGKAAQLQAAYEYNGAGYGGITGSPYVYNDPQRGKVLNLSGTLVQKDGTRVPINRPDTKGGVNAVIDEIKGVDGAPRPPVTVYYPEADWARVSCAVGQFLDPAYRKLLGAWHPGQDCNIGSGDDDLGEPVYAIADGVVVTAGVFPVWGNVVLIHHPQLGVWSNYGHFRDVYVVTGQVVSGASKIGTVGKGENNRFSAHLHFEIRLTDMPAQKWPGLDYAFIQANYVDPVKWLRAHNAQNIPRAGEDLHPTLVRIRAQMIAQLRLTRPDLRLVTTRTYDPPLAPRLGPVGPPAAGASSNRGPHSVRPALGFDFALRVGASGAVLPQSHPLYGTIGAYAESVGGRWGPNAKPAPAYESGSLRDHIQLPNTEAALKAAEDRARAGLIPSGSADTNQAGQGSDPAAADQNRRNLCPPPPGN